MQSSSMELVRFITMFFVSKKISLLTAFICWTPEKMSYLYRNMTAAGLKLRVYNELDNTPVMLAYHVHREGVLLDADCSHAADVLYKASNARAFIHRFTWLVIHDFLNISIETLLEDVNILPDSDVTYSTPNVTLDVYRIKEKQDFISTRLPLNRSYGAKDMEVFWNRQSSTVTRRKNLHNLYIKSAVVLSQPQSFKGWEDFTDRQIDTYPKLTYPLMMLLAEDLNFRHNMRQVDLYGSGQNGSWSGLAGLLQQQQVELGVCSMFMRTDRWPLLHFSSETVGLVGAFIFRQPSQSSVSNVFLLPFSSGVWWSTGGVAAGSGALLAALAAALAPAHPDLARLTLLETATFAVGTLCQQGFHLSPCVVCVRVAMFSALVCAVFLFTAYSAKIVALLQTPSDAIQSLDQLAASPLALAVQETTYKKVYFAESNEPATRRLYQRRLLPLGEKAYLSVVDGIARMRTGVFAFQVELSSGYDVISKTFTEPEKCGLKEIQAFRLPMVAIPIRKHSGYRELIAVRLRWQREAGLMSRARRRWVAERPRCGGAGAGFRSVGLADLQPALRVLAAGAALAALLLAVELLLHAIHHP